MLGSHIENYILAKQICIRSVLAQSWPNDFPGHKTKASNRQSGRERVRERVRSTPEITYFHQNVEHLKMPIDEADEADSRGHLAPNLYLNYILLAEIENVFTARQL